MMKDDTVRNIFIAVMIFLPLQYGIVGLAGYYNLSEPWPAFVFPGFKTVNVYQNSYKAERVLFEVYSADNTESVSLFPQQIFNDFPLSKINGFVRENFLKKDTSETFSPEAVSWLQNRIKARTGEIPDSVQVVEVEEIFSLPADTAIPDSTVRNLKSTIHFNISQ